MGNRRGVTLLELVVVVIILGILASVVGVTMRTTVPRRPVDSIHEQISELRNRAIRSGTRITAVISVDSVTGMATAYPDGSVLSTIGDIERVTGRSRVRQ